MPMRLRKARAVALKNDDSLLKIVVQIQDCQLSDEPSAEASPLEIRAPEAQGRRLCTAHGHRPIKRLSICEIRNKRRRRGSRQTTASRSNRRQVAPPPADSDRNIIEESIIHSLNCSATSNDFGLNAVFFRPLPQDFGLVLPGSVEGAGDFLFADQAPARIGHFITGEAFARIPWPLSAMAEDLASQAGLSQVPYR
jgi:hypothetical protein